MSRTLFATGRTPSRDFSAELVRLKGELAIATRNYRERPNHFYESRLLYARVALEDFEAAHAELDTPETAAPVTGKGDRR